jgi:hypothetical protein
MASTTTNGVVLKLPYAIIRNFQRVRPFTVSIVGTDPLRSVSTTLREFPATLTRANSGLFVYTGDTISFDLQAACNDPSALAFDLIQVNPSTGAESTAASIGFTAVWQKSLRMAVSAINASSGAVTYAITYGS